MKKVVAVLTICVLLVCGLVGCVGVPSELKESKVITSEEFWQVLKDLDYDVEANGITKYEHEEDNTARLSYSDGINLIEYVRCVDNSEAADIFGKFVDVFKNSCSGETKLKAGSRAYWKANLEGGLYCEIYLIDNLVLLGYEIDQGYGKDNMIYTLKCLRKVG